ncbi:MAG: HAMP domain-containing protein, partial [Zoogloea sp.]|nr:HAMP domain-containing protein [Zoogloea sp.]
MAKLLLPATRLMNRLSVPGKFALLGGIALIPILVLATMLLMRIQAEIDFTRKETLTVPLIKPARDMLQAVQAHRGLAQTVIGGDETLRGKLTDMRDKADAAVRAGDEAIGQHGGNLGLAESWKALRTGWEDVKAKAVSTSGEESFRLHTEFLAKVRDFIGEVADRTNASLDPEMDTYYLQDLFTQRIPFSVEHLGPARALAAGVAARHHVTDDERTELIVLRRLAEQDHAAAAGDVAKAVSAAPELKELLETGEARFGGAQSAFFEQIDKEILKAQTIEIPSRNIFEVASRAVDAGYALFDVAQQEFASRLDARLARLEGSRELALGVIAASMLVAAYLFLGFRGAMISAIAQIKHGAERMSHGKLDSSIAIDSSDAFGEIAAELNEMQQSLLLRIEAEASVAAENLRIRQGLDASSVPISLSNEENLLVYINPALRELLERMAPVVRRSNPGFSVESMFGTRLSDFFAAGEVRDLYRSHLAEPADVDTEMAGRHLRLKITPVYRDGSYQGRVTQWLDRTQESQVEAEVAGIITAAAQGIFDQRLDESNKEGFFRQVSHGLNELLDSVSAGHADIARVLNSVSRGDLTERITADYSGTFGQLKDDVNTTVERLREVVGR